MATVLTADPIIYMTPNEVRNIAVSFVGKLTINDLLSGTPTVAVSPSGPTLSAAVRNGAALKMEIPGNEHFAKTDQAVTFTVTGANCTPQAYTVTVTCPTTGGQTLQEFVTITVATS